MGELYGLPELRQMMAGRGHYDHVMLAAGTGHRNLGAVGEHYEMSMVGEMLLSSTTSTAQATQVQRGVADQFRSDSSSVSGFEEGGGNGRWPRQETLTLLEVRSRLDHKFKEASHKGPLWDEVSRIMVEEHGYQRSGKKCREKLENLYKYYKKTKEGKAGRQDGKHYRFFRQLEALYGENNNPTIDTSHVENNPCPQFANPLSSQANQEALQSQKLCESLSLSNSSEFNSSSSSDDEDLSAIAFTETDMVNTEKKEALTLKRGRRSWKSKVREFIDLQMKKFMEIQEAWMDRVLKSLEHQEQVRLAREEEWRKKESERFDREHKHWANERAWIEAQSATLIDALNCLNGQEIKVPLSSPDELGAIRVHEDVGGEIENGTKAFDGNMSNHWSEQEILTLIKLRSAMEPQFEEGGSNGCSNIALWQEVATKMRGLGYNRDAKRCKDKWEKICRCLNIAKDGNKKRKENSRTGPYFNQLDHHSLFMEGGGIGNHENEDRALETAAQQPISTLSPSHSSVATATNDSCLRFLMADGENLWESYGLKLNKQVN